ncbi:cupin domain-containing protein [Thioclava sp. BHET1]|nr:cupin domain-containing protein [Thioclava sp. BHET1]
MSNTFRRVITGHNEAGEAVVLSDGTTPFIDTTPVQVSADYFRTEAAPAAIMANTPETTDGPRRQLPGRHGTVLRMNRIPPEPAFLKDITPEAARHAFAALGNEKASTFGRGGRHPGMHRTETIDYAIVIEGEVTMLLDHEDVLLHAGDVVIQCGTNHAWTNRSEKDALIAFVLIDAEYEPELKQRFG